MNRLYPIGLLLIAPSLHAAQYLVVTHPSGGAWSVDAVEAVRINGKEKVHGSSLAANRPATWDAKSANRQPEASLQSFSVIRRAPDGNVWARAGARDGWTLLLPGGIKEKSAKPAAALWRGATIAVRRDKADKNQDSVRVEDLYAILPGMDAPASAARLATETAIHQAPGLDEALAFRNRVELLPAVMKAFPAGGSAEKLRDDLRSEMDTRVRRWSNGDAPRTILDEGLLLAGASQAAFSDDKAQQQLRDRLRSEKRRLDRRIAILRALDAGKQSDAFLVAYRDFEPFDRSFPELVQARHKHLQASALAHTDAARRLRMAGDYVGAIRHLRTARLRMPEFKEAETLLEEVRLEVARLSSQQFAEMRRGIDPRSPKQVQVERRLRLAEQYISDSKPDEAAKALEEAEAIDKDEPQTKLVQANLAVLRGDLGLALALLDVYAGMATTTQHFAEGEKLRASVQYKMENLRTQTRGQLKGLFAGRRFATALTKAADGLKVDNEEPDFLYQAGVNACVLRHCPEAAPLLRRFLELTDSTSGTREQRIAAIRLLARTAAESPKSGRRAKTAEVSWFSGAPLETGVFYDPISLAFQPKVARVTASDHLTINYEWKGNSLQSVHAKHEEKKTAGNIGRLALGLGMAAGAGAGTVGWKTAQRETNDFYFNYYDDTPQIFNVNSDKQVVKSRTISIFIPGMGGFGAFGGLGGLGALGSMRGMAGMQGIGVNKWSGIMATASSLKRPGGLSAMTGMAVADGLVPNAKYSFHADPQGGESSGYLALLNNPRIDTEVASMVTGKRVAVGFSGNHFFHPFGWDGLHMFELSYDSEGRVEHAWELDQPNPPRLDFTWDGNRLMAVTARENNQAGNVINTRTMTYTETRLTGETITAGAKTSHIRYKYDKQGRLIEAECSDDPSLDGRSRKVEFIAAAEKGRS